MAPRGRHPHHRLKDTMLRRAKAGRHVDGNSLHLYVRPNEYRSWVQRTTIAGVRHDLGLGPFPLVSLAEARTIAAQNLRLIRLGGDPRAAKARKRVPTVSEVVESVIESRRTNWEHAGTERQFRHLFATYVFPTLRDQPINVVSLDAVMDILNPIWGGRRSKGYVLRQNLSSVFRYAVAHGYRADDPAAMAKELLPKVKASPVHHPSLPYRLAPKAMADVLASEAAEPVKLFVVFAVLTAARFSEAADAVWLEINEEEALWTVPPERMKARNEHCVPLSNQALALLRSARELAPTSRVLFPFRGRGGSYNRSLRPPVSRLLKQLGLVDDRQRPVVMHGFRASFRVWAMECTDASFEVCEAALAHVQSDQTVSAYARSKLVESRRLLMQRWADHVLPGGWS